MSGLTISFARPCQTRIELAQRMRVTAALIPADHLVTFEARPGDLRLWAQAIEALEDRPAVVVSEVEREPTWLWVMLLTMSAMTTALTVLEPVARFAAAILLRGLQ